MKTNNKLQIYGLQAVAVGAIILYHAQITIYGQQLFKGGFIGVDIFFVISGYLITSIILEELITTDSFSFKNFYERRIKQIFPVLLLVILASLPFAWFYLLPIDLLNFSKSIITVFSFSSNFYFHYSGNAFGELESLSKPFVHTWLISVLAKYYILFPIILLIVFRYFRKYLIHILILGFVISLVLADWGSKNHPSLSFYVLPTRGWELLAGSILSYFEIDNGHRSKNKTLNLILPTIGLILIGHSILFFNDKMFHPSFYTLSPIVGVCLIIWFSNKNELITKILSTKLFVGVGLISYSLYLWHYPIFAFMKITGLVMGGIKGKLLLITILLICSVISYHFVEKPLRNKKNDIKNILILIFISFFILISFNLYVINNDGFKNRSHIPKIIIEEEKNLDYMKIYQDKVNCHDRLGDKGFCIFNELPDNIGDIILLGDSLTTAILGNLNNQVSKTKFRLIHMGYSGNLFLPNHILYEKDKKIILRDESWHNFRQDFIKNKSHKNTYIIYYGDYNWYFEKRIKFNSNEIVEYETPNKYVERKNININYDKRKVLLKSKLKKTLLELSKNKKIILIYPSPISPDRVFNRISNNRKKIIKDKNFYLKDPINYSLSFYQKYNDEIIELFNDINSKNIHKIELEKTFCPNSKCTMYDDKFIYIFDIAHPSHKGSILINDLIMNKIKKIELNREINQ